MRLRSFGSWTRALAGIALAGLLAFAGGEARASCYSGTQQLPAATVAAFLAGPAKLLADHPNGGAAMISLVRDLVASDPATLQPILALLVNANADQAAAVGTALGQAAQLCAKTDQPFAVQVQQALAATGNQPAILAFAAVAGDRPIGAVGGGAPGGAGGAGAGGGGGPINSTPLTLVPTAAGPNAIGLVPTQPAPITAAALATSSFTTTTTSTTTTTTAAVPVSPTRP